MKHLIRALVVLSLIATSAYAQGNLTPPQTLHHDQSLTGNGQAPSPAGVRTATGGGLTTGGGTTPLSLETDCASGQVLEWNGTSWSCMPPFVAATNATIFTASQIATWGDSLTAGFTLTDTTSYPTQLALLSGYTISNGGVSGETCSQISTRMLAATATHAYPTIIWAGRNGFDGNVAATESCIAGMVAALATKNYIVLSIINGDSAPEYSGAGVYTELIGLNNDLAATYGSHYLDVRAYLVSLYNSGIPQDVIDHGHDVPPSSLRVDYLHMNDAGYTAVANYLYAHIALLQGDPNPARVVVETDIPGILNGLFHSGPIANHVIPEGNGTGLVASTITDDLAGTVSINSATVKIGVPMSASLVQATPVGLFTPNIAIRTDATNLLAVNTITGNINLLTLTATALGLGVPIGITTTSTTPLVLNSTGAVNIEMDAVSGAKSGIFSMQTNGHMVWQGSTAGVSFDIAPGSGGVTTLYDGSTLAAWATTAGGNWEGRAAAILGWSINTSPAAAIDIGLTRASAGVLEVDNGTPGSLAILRTADPVASHDVVTLGYMGSHTGVGTITGVTAGTGLTGGGTSGTVTVGLANTAVTPGSYVNASITVNAQGQLTAASSGTAPVTSVSAGTGISVSGTTAVTVTANLAGASCSAGSYVSALSATGTGTCTPEVGDISSVTAGTSLSGGGTSGAVTLNVALPGGTCGAGNHVSAIAADGTATCSADTGGGGAEVLPTITVTGASGVVTNYAPTGIATATVVDITTSGAFTIAGFSASQVTGRVLVVRNNALSTDSINFVPGWGGTTAGNRLQITGGANWSMRTGSSTTFVYDGTTWAQESMATVTFPSLLADGNLTIGGTSALFGATKIGTGGDSTSTTGSLIYATNAGTTTISARDSTNHVEGFLSSASSGVFVGSVTNNPLWFETNGTQAMVIGTDQNVGFKAHLTSSGTKPTLSACGSSPTIFGDDNIWTVVTGGGATACTVNFANSWSASDVSCVLTGNDATSGGYYISSFGSGAITFKAFSTGFAGNIIAGHCGDVH